MTFLSILRRLESRLPKNAFWRSLAIVAGGTAVGQALSIAASPLLSRLYGPSDFGLLSVYVSLTSIVGVVSSLAYHQAIPAPESEEDAANLTVLALTLTTLISVLAGVVVIFLRAPLERYFGIPGFGKYVALVPLGVFGLSTYEVLTQWAARRKAFGLIAKTSAQRSIVQVIVQVSGGVAKLGSASLVIGQLLSQWGGTVRLARGSWQESRAVFRAVSADSLRKTARKFRDFPKFTLPGLMLNAIDANAAPLLFAHFFGADITGYFALGHRLIAIPFQLVGSSAQKVFYPAAAAAKHGGTLARETDETFRRLLRLVLPIVTIMTACAPELFTVVMGAKWREAGVYMQWLSLRACFTMLVFPLTPLIYVLNRQAAGTLFSGLQLVVRIGAVYVGCRLGSARLAVALLGVGTGILWLVYLGYLLSISGNSLPRAVRGLFRETLFAVGLASPVVATKLLHGTDIAVTFAAALAGLIGLAVVARRSGPRGDVPHGPGTLS